MTEIAAAVAALRREARATDGRRLLAVVGESHETCRAVADTATDLAVVSGDDSHDILAESVETYERQPAPHAGRLMGTTHETVVYDGVDEFSPDAVGRTVGAVAGGGLYVLLLPTDWTDRTDDFRASLAVPPFDAADPTNAFRERVLETFDHPGVAVYDADEGRLRRDGLTGRERPPPRSDGTLPADPGFPLAAYEACRTADQGRSLRALERLREPETAVVVEADRGRGKSTVAGLAAGALAAAGSEVVVTAPTRSNAATLLQRATELTGTLGARSGTEPLVTAAGGRVAYVPPTEVADRADDADAVFVDEAAGLPVATLSATLAADRAAFVTTVHGYEGAGRGFSVRFRDRLADARHTVTETRPTEPIRHAPGDPLESWSFRALALDARPAVDQLLADASLADATYRRLSTDRLRTDDHLLREVFGLLVVAHYRTEPTDLARLLDAPNLSVHALLVSGHVAAVALVAREGGLSERRRRELFDGGRIHGNMVPDLLGGQLRDPDAARPVGYRVVRVATHGVLRRSGFGSRLLSAVETDLADGADRPGFAPADYFSSGFGASPGVVDFWRQNGYRTVHLSTTRNDTSGEHSAVVVRPVTDAGRAFAARHGQGFRDRVAGVLSDGLSDLSPDVVRATLRACGADPEPLLELTDYEWRVVVGAGTGPTGYGVAPDPFRRLAVAWFLDTDAPGDTPADDIDARRERLLVRKVLQGHAWDDVTEELGFVSTGECMRTLGETVTALVDRFGGDRAARERARYD
ncbi:tRNA(Met) cytidine acetyltransferase TmcA [Halobaculum sp. MBLA0143]|uniref:tRNA(Met) cytidine acetyltransferase TmcA n=1 Tax=Halobaculum sp. MBLA0143 TaxID=3079933 RepID=UPI003524E635